MPQPASRNRFALAHGILKALAISCGLVLSTFCLMAIVGLFTDNGWIRFAIAAVVVLAVPMIAIDRALPQHDPAAAKGLATDVLALILLGFPVLFAIGANGLTKNLLAREGDRLVLSGWDTSGRIVHWVAGFETEVLPAPLPQPPPAASSR